MWWHTTDPKLILNYWHGVHRHIKWKKGNILFEKAKLLVVPTPPFTRSKLSLTRSAPPAPPWCWSVKCPALSSQAAPEVKTCCSSDLTRRCSVHLLERTFPTNPQIPYDPLWSVYSSSSHPPHMNHCGQSLGNRCVVWIPPPKDQCGTLTGREYV